MWTEEGPIEIIDRRFLTTGESVYNIEVHGHHNYQVSELGLLVHNAKKLRYGKSQPKAVKGGNFSKGTKKKTLAENKAKYDNRATCEKCKKRLVKGKKSQTGVRPRPNTINYDHKKPKAKGGTNSVRNGQILCQRCNRNKSDTYPPRKSS